MTVAIAVAGTIGVGFPADVVPVVRPIRGRAAEVPPQTVVGPVVPAAAGSVAIVPGVVERT
jgi:hypothetical protein